MGQSVESSAENPYASPPSAVLPASEPQIKALPLECELRELFMVGKNGAAWFYWIAVLSLINTVIALSQGGIMFALGLDLMMITDTIAANIALQPGGNLAVLGVALVFDAVVLGLLVLCGRLAQRRVLSVFAFGMGLYFLDGLLSLMLGSIVSIMIHAYALWSMWRGFWAFRQLNRLETRLLSAGPAPFSGV
jgi:hypothetical protein